MHGLARDAKLPWPGQNWLFMAEMQGLDYVVGCPINHFLLPNWSREKVLTKTKSTKGICISSAMCVWQCVLIVIGAILSTLCRRDRAAWASSCVTLHKAKHLVRPTPYSDYNYTSDTYIKYTTMPDLIIYFLCFHFKRPAKVDMRIKLTI